MATQEELHAAAVKIGRANPQGREGASKYLKQLDYSVLQQCIHCGMCLPTCPTYDETKLERNSPRGRIALMRSIAEGRLEVTQAFGRELYFCLGCLTCETVCPAQPACAAWVASLEPHLRPAGVHWAACSPAIFRGHAESRRARRATISSDFEASAVAVKSSRRAARSSRTSPDMTYVS